MGSFAKMLAPVIVLATSCAPSPLHVSGAEDARAYLEAFDGSASGVNLGHVRLKKSDCEKSDLTPVYRPLDGDDFIAFLRAENLDVTTTRARADLELVDVKNLGTSAPLRFRVAILETSGKAGRDLHEALLQHGEGSWGVHRSNLAILGPSGSLDDVVVLAVKSKLACWGVLTVAGHDDTFVIPGGYTEL